METPFKFTFFMALLLTSCVVLSTLEKTEAQGAKPISCNTDADCKKVCKTFFKCSFHVCECQPGNPNCC
ncbi:defensin-like protein 278 [Carica papaya]|uniref:defensin-like protein 278 n=1 Tax=Carica papaya TaxID=3649 RepID=UPI000B8D01AA|nr:defensin-like protein 278 [Carica papaya]